MTKLEIIARDFEQLGIEKSLAKKLAEIQIKDENPYYERSDDEKQLFEKAFKIMSRRDFYFNA